MSEGCEAERRLWEGLRDTCNNCFATIFSRKVMANLRYIHFHFHTYLPTYFIGILMAYCVKGKGYHLKSRLFSFAMTVLFYAIAVSHPLFLFHFKLVPESWIPSYAISQKVFLAIGIIFNYLRDDCEEELYKGMPSVLQLESMNKMTFLFSQLQRKGNSSRK